MSWRQGVKKFLLPSLVVFGFIGFASSVSAAPQVSITASPDVVYRDEPSTLTWTISGAVSCYFAELPGGGAEGSTTNGSSIVHPRRDTQYSISCEDSAGEVNSARTRIAVVPRVTVSIDPTTSTSTTGQVAVVTWSSDGDSCRDWSGTSISPSGSTEVYPSATTTYTVTCLITGGSKNGSGSATITFIHGAGGCPGPINTTWGTGCSGGFSGDLSTGQSRVVENSASGYSGQVTVKCSVPPDGITKSGPFCEGNGAKCTGVEPWLISSYTEIYPGEAPGPWDTDTPWQFSSSNTDRKCEFHCKPGSEWVSSKSGWACSPPGGGDGPPSRISLLVDKPTVKLGESVSLSWSATGVPDGGSCAKSSNTSDPGWTGSLDKAQLESGGNQIVLPSNVSGINKAGRYTYYLCTSPVSVTVVDFPEILSFVADPDTVDAGQTSILRWDVNNANKGCNLSKGSVPATSMADVLWSGNGEITTSFGVHPTTSTYYTLECYNDSGTSSDSRTHKTALVHVNGTPDPSPPPGPSPSPSPGPSPIPPTGGDGSCLNPNLCQAGSCGTDRHSVPGTCLAGGEVCCGLNPISSPGDGYFNPLKYDSLDSVLTDAMGTIQGIIVVLSIIFIIIGALIYITSGGSESRITLAKSAITAAMIGLAIAIAAPSFLKEIAAILGWSGVNNAQVTGAQSFTQIASKVLNFLLSIVGVIAIIMLVIGGFMYLTAAGDEGKAETGKKIVTYAIIAITIALSALVLVTQVAKLFV